MIQHDAEFWRAFAAWSETLRRQAWNAPKKRKGDAK